MNITTIISLNFTGEVKILKITANHKLRRIGLFPHAIDGANTIGRLVGRGNEARLRLVGAWNGFHPIIRALVVFGF